MVYADRIVKAAYDKKWKDKNRERQRIHKCVSQKKRRIENPRWALLTSARYRAKRKQIEFCITVEDIEIPEFCPIFGIKLVANIEKSNDNSPSLDRIDNTKGYIPGNVAVISHRANSLKRNASIEEIKKLLKYMERKRDSKENS